MKFKYNAKWGWIRENTQKLTWNYTWNDQISCWMKAFHVMIQKYMFRVQAAMSPWFLNKILTSMLLGCGNESKTQLKQEIQGLYCHKGLMNMKSNNAYTIEEREFIRFLIRVRFFDLLLWRDQWPWWISKGWIFMVKLWSLDLIWSIEISPCIDMKMNH